MWPLELNWHHCFYCTPTQILHQSKYQYWHWQSDPKLRCPWGNIYVGGATAEKFEFLLFGNSNFWPNKYTSHNKQWQIFEQTYILISVWLKLTAVFYRPHDFSLSLSWSWCKIPAIHHYCTMALVCIAVWNRTVRRSVINSILSSADLQVRSMHLRVNLCMSACAGMLSVWKCLWSFFIS